MYIVHFNAEAQMATLRMVHKISVLEIRLKYSFP